VRVLVIVHGFPPQAQGGSEIYADEHARALVERGHDVLVLTRERDITQPERHIRFEQRNGMRVAWVNNTFADTTSYADSYEHARLADAVMPVIDDWAPDVAHIHHLTCLSTRIVLGLSERQIPVFHTLHDYWLMCHRGQLLDRELQICSGPGDHGCGRCVGPPDPPMTSVIKSSGLARTIQQLAPAAVLDALARTLRHLDVPKSPGGAAAEAARVAHMRAVCSRITRFLAPSRHIRDAHLRFGIEPSRISWSPYGFNHAMLRQSGPITRRGPLQIGFIGTLMPSKAPDVLLEAHRLLDEGSAELHLFGASADYHGDTSYRARLAPLLSFPGVHQHGPRPHAQIPAVLSRLDVLVVPSVWPENSPLVIQEAMIAGVTVVASRIGGIVELIESDADGFLFEPGNVAELASILATLTRRRPARTGSAASRIRTLADDAKAAEGLYRDLAASGTTAGAVSRRLSAVVVNYRTPEHTELALRALRASAAPLHDIIGVNNDVETGPAHLSTLGSLWIHTGANLGFSGGVNAGVREALSRGATHVLLVNSDVSVPPGTAERLFEALERVPGAGIAAPVIVSRTRPDEVASAGIHYTHASGRMRHQHFGAGFDTVFPLPTAAVDAVSGCVMLIRREVFERAGYFDEAYFYGFEDIDFCLRAAAHGFSSVIAGDSAVYHHGGQSIGALSPRRLYFAARNHLLLADRVSGADARATRLARSATIVFLNLAHAALSPGRSRAAAFASVARGVADYTRGRFGSGD
jgi:GT2 family glycosyltransferase/glycosyltransferase involved in cell wall biosynthesis